MKAVLSLVSIALLAGCASAPSGASFNERLEAKALAEISGACAGKTGDVYERCAYEVRSKVFAQTRTSMSSLRASGWDKNMANVNRDPGAGETSPN